MPTTQNQAGTEGNRNAGFVPNGWTARIEDGETVYESPSGQIRTTNPEDVEARVHRGGGHD